MLSPLCGSRFLTGQVLPACLGPWLGLGAASSPTSAGAQFAHLAAFPPAPPGVGQRHSSCLAHEAGAPSSAATRPPSRLPSRDSAERARGAVSGHRGLCPATHTCTRWRRRGWNEAVGAGVTECGRRLVSRGQDTGHGGRAREDTGRSPPSAAREASAVTLGSSLYASEARRRSVCEKEFRFIWPSSLLPLGVYPCTT